MWLDVRGVEHFWFCSGWLETIEDIGQLNWEKGQVSLDGGEILLDGLVTSYGLCIGG